MKTISKLLVLGVLTCVANAMFAAELPSISAYGDSIPGIGLISDTIEFDGVKISDFHFENDKKFIFVDKNQEVPVHFKYEIEASKVKTLYLHHLIIGLYDDGPQKCVLRTLGIKDSKGTAKLKLKAPDKVGAYQVRFCLTEGLTDEGAMKAWWRGEGPSAKTIVGIIIVK